jgi:4-cresol dehydrogenase (hydroxylating)
MNTQATCPAATFDEATDPVRDLLPQIVAIVGQNQVICEGAEVEVRSRVIIPRGRRPVGFVYPGSVEEVVALVRLANAHRLPLWPCGKGKNWGYGAATPAEDGGLVMVLERMNRILKIDREMAYAVVEPGVTYRQLHRHLQENNIPLWLDCTDGPADGSVIGNALERGVGETDYGDHFGNLCGMEVVLADGTVVQTGGGPHDAYKSWSTYKWGVGPYLEGLFSQANFGIVTKAGMWLMPKPEYFTSCVFELHREEDFPGMIDAMRRLQMNGALKSKAHIINDIVSFAVAVPSPKELLAGARCLSDQRRAELRRQLGIAPWTFAAGLYGTRAQVRANVALIKKELGRLGSLQFIDDGKIRAIGALARLLRRGEGGRFTRPLAEFFSRRILKKRLSLIEFLPQVHAIEKGYPSDYFVKHAYYKSRRPKPDDRDIDPARDGCGCIWLGPMVPLNGRDVSEVLGLVVPLYRKYGFDLSAALMVANPRTVIALMSIFYDKEDADETARAAALYYEMGEVTQAAGYQQYRTSTMFMDRIFRPAPTFQNLCARIKEALDPNDILAPGKYGIGGRVAAS